MATLDSLKWALRRQSVELESLKKPLSDTQYSAGFKLFTQNSGCTSYNDFVVPQLSQLLIPLFNSGTNLSVLEIGPGPESVLGYLPLGLRQRFRSYTAYEPNLLFSSRLEEWFCAAPDRKSPLPCLDSPPNIHQVPFLLDDKEQDERKKNAADGDEKYDVILFIHSMYGMRPKYDFIQRALKLLNQNLEGGLVVVFHRDEALNFEKLVCHRTASFSTGTISLMDDDEVLGAFAPFVAGFTMKDLEVDRTVRIEWIKTCRALGFRDANHPDHLLFGSPEIMVAFNRHAIKLPGLKAHIPFEKMERAVKNWEARLHQPASIIRPTNIQQIQKCIQWALEHKVGLTVIGGGHSGHCRWPNVVAIDMDAFNRMDILGTSKNAKVSDIDPYIVVEAGCKTGDIIQKAMAAGLTVPLGSRPGVGAGLWLQGGIGHLSRLHGLACDSIIGAVVVSLDSCEIFYVGHVPRSHRPAGAIRPKNENEILWGIKGAATSIGIVASVTFKAYTAPMYSVRNWVLPLDSNIDARLKINDFNDSIAKQLPRQWSADAYLFWETGQLHLGITIFGCGITTKSSTEPPAFVYKALGMERDFKIVDGVELFDTEMYVSGMHGGHGGGKTYAFKRCLFLKDIGDQQVADKLVAAIQSRPSSLCYLHLLQGGGAISDIAPEASAFGCRDWDFACIITGIWPREQNENNVARTAIQWVYDVVKGLLPFSRGVYGADLGPADPRDAMLATKAFGPNLSRIIRLKYNCDPVNVLAYACPIKDVPPKQKVVILVTGDSGAGKDYCADLWVSLIDRDLHSSLRVCSVSISDATKREYAIATGSDLNKLLSDRNYKEKHRPALTAFYEDQVRRRPQLPIEHFLNVVQNAVDVDVLLITGMRDEAPITTLSYLIPDRRLLDVRIKASKMVQWIRQGRHEDDYHDEVIQATSVLAYHPSFIFDNEMTGNEAAEKFAERYLLPFFRGDLQLLKDMARKIPNFPRPGIEFRHVLNISQQPGGLTLCTSLLKSHFNGNWSKIDALACCEAGGFIFASALATQVKLPLVLARESGKLPEPTVSVMKSPSHISCSTSTDETKKLFEINQDVIRKGASVVIVDDVLATGKTLCAMLHLLVETGVCVNDVSILVVAEFPIHRGRELLRQHGFGGVSVQSLLIFSNA